MGFLYFSIIVAGETPVKEIRGIPRFPVKGNILSRVLTNGTSCSTIVNRKIIRFKCSLFQGENRQSGENPGRYRRCKRRGRPSLAKASHWETGKTEGGRGRSNAPLLCVSQKTCLEIASVTSYDSRGMLRKTGRGSEELPRFLRFQPPHEARIFQKITFRRNQT